MLRKGRETTARSNNIKKSLDHRIELLDGDLGAYNSIMEVNLDALGHMKTSHLLKCIMITCT